VKGVILDANPVDGVNIACASFSTNTNQTIYFNKSTIWSKAVLVLPTSLLKKATVTVLLKANEDYEFNLVMNGQTRNGQNYS
jgi:hypothetical protein